MQDAHTVVVAGAGRVWSVVEALLFRVCAEHGSGGPSFLEAVFMDLKRTDTALLAGVTSAPSSILSLFFLLATV